MKKFAAAFAFMFLFQVAHAAEPLVLSDQQLDKVTAGLITGVDFTRIFTANTRGLFVTVTSVDTQTGQVSVRRFGRTFIFSR